MLDVHVATVSEYTRITIGDNKPYYAHQTSAKPMMLPDASLVMTSVINA